MSQAYDVVVLSAFGRGQWMAAELASQYDLKVCLVDVSEQMGNWSPEDWEGPFGLFSPEELTQTQTGRLSSEDYSDLNDQGMTVWLKNGPIDFMGPVTQFWLDQDGPVKRFKEYLGQWEAGQGGSKKQLKEKVLREDFEKTWMIHLSHQMASTIFSDNARSVLVSSPLPFFAPWSTRRNTRKGYQRSLEWCEERGVKVFRKAQINDVEITAGKWASVEIQCSEFAGAIRGQQLAWLFSSIETQRLQPNSYEQLFPKGLVEPDWTWIRYRYNLELGAIEGTVPKHFLMIQDLGLPWSHENFVLAQKVVTDGGMDLWTRIPYHQRFQRDLLEKFSRDLLNLLKQRFPGVEPSLTDMPQEYHYEYQGLGPSLFPVYGENNIKKVKRVSTANIQWGGPESWERLDWTGRFAQDQVLVDKIVAYKTVLMKKEKKSDPEVHAP